jgi:hypothetical protein
VGTIELVGFVTTFIWFEAPAVADPLDPWIQEIQHFSIAA